MENNTQAIIMKYVFFLLFLSPFVLQAKTINLTPSGATSLYISDAATNSLTSSYLPGDTLMVTADVSGWYMANVHGEPNNYVVITAAPGVVIGGGSSRNFELYSCSYFKCVNLYSNGRYNATWTGNAKFNYKVQFSTDMIFENVWGVGGSDGISIKSDPTATNPNSQYPNQIIRNVVLINCTMDSTNNEGFYLGNTGTAPYDSSNNRPAPIYGLYMKNCTARWTGWDGVQVTNAFNCVLDGIVCLRNGLTKTSGQSQGVTIQDRTGGAFMNMVIDSVEAAALNIFSCDSVYYKNITITNASLTPSSNAIFVDNRTSQDYPFCRPRTLYMENVSVNGWHGASAINVNNNQNDPGRGNPLPLLANPGKIYNFTYDATNWGIADNLNTYYGGNRPGNIPYTPDSTTQAIFQYYDDGTRDIFGGKVATSPVQLKPMAPINFGGVANYQHYVTFTWDTCKWNGNSIITSQKLYKKTGTGNYSLYQTLPPDATTFQDNSVTDNTTYSWAITSVNANGESLRLNDFTMLYVTPPAPPTPTIPGVPGNFAGIGNNGSVSLSWTYPALDGYSTVTQYKVYRGLSSGSLSLLTTLGSQTSYIDNAVTNETTYYYAVSAINAIGEGSQTTPIPVKPTQYSVSDPVTQFTVTPTATSTIVIAWQEPANTGGVPITGYKLYRGTNGTSFNLIGTYNSSTFTVTDNTRVSGTRYYYYIRAVNSIGDSAPSVTQSAIAP